MRTVALALLATVTLAACTSGGDTKGAGAPASAPHSTGAPTTSPAPAQSASPAPGSPGAKAPVPPTARGDCVKSVEEATVRLGDPPGATCLIVGAELRITSAPAPAVFLPLESSDPTVVRCTPTAMTNRTMNATCTALRPGTATVSAIVQKRGGQPDPPEYVWQLAVRVVA